VDSRALPGSTGEAIALYIQSDSLCIYKVIAMQLAFLHLAISQREEVKVPTSRLNDECESVNDRLDVCSGNTLQKPQVHIAISNLKLLLFTHVDGPAPEKVL